MSDADQSLAAPPSHQASGYGMETQLAERGYTRRCRPRRPEAHLHAADLGDPLLGYRFMPGECIANSRLVEVFRQGKRTQKERMRVTNRT